MDVGLIDTFVREAIDTARSLSQGPANQPFALVLICSRLTSRTLRHRGPDRLDPIGRRAYSVIVRVFFGSRPPNARRTEAQRALDRLPPLR
jgi:hypothetical protein